MSSDSSAARWAVHKFGGSSLADASAFARVADLIAMAHRDHSMVVVSAMGQTTDHLVALIDAAVAGQPIDALMASLRDDYAEIASALLGSTGLPQFEADLTEIQLLCQTLSTLRCLPRPAYDFLVGYGELWSSRLLSQYLNHRGMQASALDAREILVTEADDGALASATARSASDHGRMALSIDLAASSVRLESWMNDPLSHGSDIIVTTGFIAANRDRTPVTLGRNGSDYSAAVFGHLLAADQVTIWTDVPGIMNADPRWVPDAAAIATLSYAEALELAYFGASVLHPRTIGPLRERSIPLRIASTFEPREAGTLIGETSAQRRSIKGVTAVTDVALLTLKGPGLAGVIGSSERLFDALKQAATSAILIAQASSEQAITVAIDEHQADQAQAAINEKFALEISRQQIEPLQVTRQCSIVAAIGDAMAGHPGVAARLFRALANASVNVRAIAQDPSERNISVVIDADQTRRAIRAIHAGFYLSPQTLAIGLIGPGTVGAVLLEQWAEQLESLRVDSGIDLRLMALARSSGMLLSDSPIAMHDWRKPLAASNQPLDLEQFADHLRHSHLPHAVIIDCTADDAMAARHADWLAMGLHVITPNKKGHAGDLERYRNIRASSQSSGSHYLFETTVGAGLPVIGTLRDLRQTGDRIRSIRGVLSGTLSYLFNRYDGQIPFSAMVVQARDNGFTEPDPRDDLSGMDVARKLLILAREAGMMLSLQDIEIHSLVPESLRDCDPEAFVQALGQMDDAIRTRYQRAREQGCVLRYVARLDESGRAHVGLEEIPDQHAFAHIQLTDNVIEFVTDRYADNPMIIRGPGAGPAVTAAGLFADLLRLSSMIGASR